MDKRNIIPEINGFNDLLKKFEYDLNRYKKNNHSYELMDCIMTLNSLPDWIRKSSNASENLRILANEKIIIMKGHGGFKFDENQIEDSIDHKLRFIRLFCNHSKHKTESGEIPRIISEYGAIFPITFPAKLYNIIALGEKHFDAEYLITEVYEFWKRVIEQSNQNEK